MKTLHVLALAPWLGACALTFAADQTRFATLYTFTDDQRVSRP